MADHFARLKWRWLDQLMHDHRLSPRSRCVGYEIARHLNAQSGDAWPSQETMRKNLGFKHKNQISRAVQDIRRLGYFQVSVDLKTHSNTYVPNFSVVTPQGVPTPQAVSGQVHEATPQAVLPRHQNQAFGDTTGGAQSSLRELQTDKGPSADTGGCDRGAVSWTSVKNRLRISLSPGMVTSWFEPAELVTITDTEVVLRMHSRFARRQVENNHLGDRLTDAWRAELGAAVTVRLVDPVARAAE